MYAALPPPTGMADALAYAAQTVWNRGQDHLVFSRTECERAGSQYRQRAYVCSSRVKVRRTGLVRELRFVILANGEVTRSRFHPLRDFHKKS